MNSIEQALDALKNGKIIVVTDDADRENESDLVCAAQFATAENVNFMAKFARGLICMPMSEYYAEKLGLPQMVTRNTDNHETAFTVSIDSVKTTTGISAEERSATALACVDERTAPADLRICFRCSQRLTACSNATGIPKRRSISAVWRG